MILPGLNWGFAAINTSKTIIFHPIALLVVWGGGGEEKELGQPYMPRCRSVIQLMALEFAEYIPLGYDLLSL